MCCLVTDLIAAGHIASDHAHRFSVALLHVRLAGLPWKILATVTFRRAKLLLVEDDAEVRELLMLRLRSDYDIQQAEDATQAHLLCQATVFNLVVVDVRLPGRQSGTEFALELMRVRPEVQAIFISGLPIHRWRKFDQEDLRAMPECAYSFLKKPFLPTALQERIRELMRRHTDAPR